MKERLEDGEKPIRQRRERLQKETHGAEIEAGSGIGLVVIAFDY